MATVEKDLEKKQEVVNQSGCCGGVAAVNKEKVETELQVKQELDPKQSAQIRSCCG